MLSLDSDVGDTVIIARIDHTHTLIYIVGRVDFAIDWIERDRDRVRSSARTDVQCGCGYRIGFGVDNDDLIILSRVG